ncbi:MAG TPA: hypothetical protein VF666_08800 [Pyrinomonadaceae bacterium]
MQPTIYDDGKSCPGGCDAHVVFNAVHNGTRNAFDPSSSRSAPRKCRVGRQCKICFSANDASCMTALYRGGGPDVGRFDFTPAFYEENCTRTGLPEQFAAKCRSAAPIIERLKTQVNCIINPTHEKCRALMEPFVRRKAADDVLYAECKRLGLTAFNRKYRETPALQRSLDCNYEMLRTGRNSRGQTWRRLLDGACKPGTYAGRDGLDCCSGSLYAAALLDTECTQFFARR